MATHIIPPIHVSGNPLPGPVIGQVYFDAAKAAMMCWDGTVWKAVVPTVWNLFIDDIRNTIDVALSPLWLGIDIRIARTCEEAIGFVDSYGLPERISFDHDLGPDTSHATKIMWHIINGHIDEKWNCRTMKEVMVHSVNTPGAENLLKLWEGFCREFELDVPISWKPALK